MSAKSEHRAGTFDRPEPPLETVKLEAQNGPASGNSGATTQEVVAPMCPAPYPARERTNGTPRVCGWCGEGFIATKEHRSFTRKYCSPSCSGKAVAAKKQAKYPPREEMVRLYEVEGLSDADIGRRFGHSYTWSMGVRRFYGIAGRPVKGRSKPLAQKCDQSRWGIRMKREEACRNCRAEGVTLHLHHVVPRSMCAASKYDLRNGVPLCTACHLGWHHRRVTLYRDIFTAEEWAYISTIPLYGQNLEAWLEDRYPERVEEEWAA